jgi:hypothetical protein
MKQKREIFCCDEAKSKQVSSNFFSIFSETVFCFNEAKAGFFASMKQKWDR